MRTKLTSEHRSENIFTLSLRRSGQGGRDDNVFMTILNKRLRNWEHKVYRFRARVHILQGGRGTALHRGSFLPLVQISRGAGLGAEGARGQGSTLFRLHEGCQGHLITHRLLTKHKLPVPGQVPGVLSLRSGLRHEVHLIGNHGGWNADSRGVGLLGISGVLQRGGDDAAWVHGQTGILEGVGLGGGGAGLHGVQRLGGRPVGVGGRARVVMAVAVRRRAGAAAIGAVRLAVVRGAAATAKLRLPWLAVAGRETAQRHDHLVLGMGVQMGTEGHALVQVECADRALN